jgi:hypothetical protein
MRQKTKKVRNQGSNDKKNGFFGSVPKSPTQMGSLSIKNTGEKFSRLGTLKRDMAMRQIFWGFCRNRTGSACPLHYVLSRSDFSFKFSEIFVIEKRLPDSASRGVRLMPCPFNKNIKRQCPWKTVNQNLEYRKKDIFESE